MKGPEEMEYRLAAEEDYDSLYRFVVSQRLEYPDFEKWAEKAVEDLRNGYKKAVLAEKEGIVGDIIFQRSREAPEVLELKNVFVDERYRE